MTKVEIMNKMTRTIGRMGLQLKKHSPEILVVAGVAGTIVSAVMACKATTKIDTILSEAKEKVETIHECTENPDLQDKYTAEDSKKDLALVYTQTGMNLIKLYGPSIALGVASIGCILASNNIIRKRNVALAAAYTAVDNSFKEYRGRVVERFGKELDRELKYNIKSQIIEEVSVDENGNETVTQKAVEVADPNVYSEYSIVFMEGNLGWDDDPFVTKKYLVRQQNWANEKLQAQGHLFLNEVYDMLGVRRTQAGGTVGWIYDESGDGDNYVDFGMFDINKPKACDFVNGLEKAIILDFNVDGPILNRI